MLVVQRATDNSKESGESVRFSLAADSTSDRVIASQSVALRSHGINLNLCHRSSSSVQRSVLSYIWWRSAVSSPLYIPSLFIVKLSSLRRKKMSVQRASPNPPHHVVAGRQADRKPAGTLVSPKIGAVEVPTPQQKEIVRLKVEAPEVHHCDDPAARKDQVQESDRDAAVLRDAAQLDETPK